MWGDASGGWQQAGVAWVGVLAGAGVPFRTAADETAAEGDDLLIVADPERTPDAVERARKEGRPWLAGRPQDGPLDALAAVRDALGALVRPDLRGALVLRLDDPGASVRRHLRGWAHPDVEPATWDALWSHLRGFGRASVFCCPGWVDAAGRVTRSRDANPSEWAALDGGVSEGLVDLECHGYTHLHPDTVAWAHATDRFDDPSWYRELWPPRDPQEPPTEAQEVILAAWQEACGPGTTLVAPGEGWGVNTIAAARRRGLDLFTSWGVCRLRLEVPVWSVGIGSPYLDEASATWFADGLPTIGYWHDRDMAVHGPQWVGEQIEAWRDCGARRALAFADLAAAYRTPIDAVLVHGDVKVASRPPVPLLVELRP
jgi:hypothetical protein